MTDSKAYSKYRSAPSTYSCQYRATVLFQPAVIDPSVIGKCRYSTPCVATVSNADTHSPKRSIPLATVPRATDRCA
eukprot:3652108-Rhodomonas_salina.1